MSTSITWPPIGRNSHVTKLVTWKTNGLGSKDFCLFRWKYSVQDWLFKKNKKQTNDAGSLRFVTCFQLVRLSRSSWNWSEILFKRKSSVGKVAVFSKQRTWRMRILRYSQWNQLRANKPFKDVINENFICTDLQRAAVRRYPLGWSALPFWIAGSSTPSRGWNNPPRTKPETGPNRCARPKRRSSRSMSPNTPEMIINLITIFFNWINFKFVNFLK